MGFCCLTKFLMIFLHIAHFSSSLQNRQPCDLIAPLYLSIQVRLHIRNSKLFCSFHGGWGVVQWIMLYKHIFIYLDKCKSVVIVDSFCCRVRTINSIKGKAFWWSVWFIWVRYTAAQGCRVHMNNILNIYIYIYNYSFRLITWRISIVRFIINIYITQPGLTIIFRTFELSSFSLLFIGRHLTITLTASGPAEVILYLLVFTELDKMILLISGASEGQVEPFSVSFFHLIWNQEFSTILKRLQSFVSFIFWV